MCLDLSVSLLIFLGTLVNAFILSSQAVFFVVFLNQEMFSLIMSLIINGLVSEIFLCGLL